MIAYVAMTIIDEDENYEKLGTYMVPGSFIHVF
jgi:hypothetical protein